MAPSPADEQGDPYTLDAVLESQYLFDDSQYFSAVSSNRRTQSRYSRSALAVRAERTNAIGMQSAPVTAPTRMRAQTHVDNRYLNTNGHRSQVQLIGSEFCRRLMQVRGAGDGCGAGKIRSERRHQERRIGDLTSRGKNRIWTDRSAVTCKCAIIRLSQETTEPTSSDLDLTRYRREDILDHSRHKLWHAAAQFTHTLAATVFAVCRALRFAEIVDSDATFCNCAQMANACSISRLVGVRVCVDKWASRGRMISTVCPRRNVSLRARQQRTRFGSTSYRRSIPPQASALAVNILRRVGRVGTRYPNRWWRQLSCAVFVDAGNAIDHFSDRSSTRQYRCSLSPRRRSQYRVDVAQALSDNRSRASSALATLF